MGSLKYVDFISTSKFYSGGFQRVTSPDDFRYISSGEDNNIIYSVSNSGFTTHETNNTFGASTTFTGFYNKTFGSGYLIGGDYVQSYGRDISDSYVYNYNGLTTNYTQYHSTMVIGNYNVLVYSNPNISGLVSYERDYTGSNLGVSFFDIIYADNIGYISTLSNPGTEMISNILINVNGYIIGGFVDVGLMSFSIDGSGNLTQEDRISGGTNDYVQSVVNYGDYLYFTTAGSSNSGSLRRTELTGGGTFSNTSTIVSSGTTAGGIIIKGDNLYYGTQMELHKFQINSGNGNLTFLETFDLSTTYFTSAEIRYISLDTITDYMVLETSEGRVLVVEEGDPIPAGSKNRVIFMM